MNRLLPVATACAAAALAASPASASTPLSATVTESYLLSGSATHYLKGGKLSRVDIFPETGTAMTVQIAEGAHLQSTWGVPVNGVCDLGTAQIQASVKTSAGTGTATVLCVRTSADGSRARFMLAYGFDSATKNCVTVTTATITPSANCPASVTSWRIGERSNEPLEGSPGPVVAPFTATMGG